MSTIRRARATSCGSRPARGSPSTCRPGGWRRSTTATPRRRRALRADLDYAAWCTAFGESGFATPTWPAEYGAGLSLAPGQARAVNEVLNHYRVPRPTNIIGIGMGGPTVIAWGSEELKQQFLRGIATNEEIWCQLFSEPGAGSDVAGLADARRARRRRVDRERAEGVDVARAPRPLRDAAGAHRSRPAEAQGPQLLRRRHAPAGGRGAAAAPDHRRRRVQRGLLRERAHPRRVAARAGRRRVAGRHHHADERAGLAVGPGLGERRHHRRQPGATDHRPQRAGARPEPAAAPRRRRGSTTASSRSTTSAPAIGVAAAPRSGPRARSPSCRARSSTSGCRSWPSTSRARTASRGRAGGSPRRRRSASSAARPTIRAPWRAGSCARRPTPSRAGRRRSCATSSASACSGSRRIPTSRATCRGRTSPLA